MTTTPPEPPRQPDQGKPDAALGQPAHKAVRDTRIKAALRANLQRRKAQARLRARQDAAATGLSGPARQDQDQDLEQDQH